MCMKKLMTLIVIVMFMTVSTTGCVLTQYAKSGYNYAMGVVELKKESELVKEQYVIIYDMVLEKEDAFSPDEMVQLNDVHFAFTETATRVEWIIRHPEDAVTPEELRRMYELAYIGYTTARAIVADHRDAFSDYNWKSMVAFDEQLKLYDVDVRAILDNPDTEDINKTLGLIITLGGVAYKYILPVVVSMTSK